MALNHALAGGIDDAVASTRAAVAAADRTGLVGLRAHAQTYRGFVLMLKGDLDAAAQDLADAERGLAAGSSVVRQFEVDRYQAYLSHHRGDSAAALRRIGAVVDGPRSAIQTRSAKHLVVEIHADLADPRALELAGEATRSAADDVPDPFLPNTIEAGLRCALWLERRAEAQDLEKSLARITDVAPVDHQILIGAQAMAALLRGDAAAAVPKLEEACASARRFLPLYLPRWQFHLAYALALVGRRDQAEAAAAAAVVSYERLGNQPERARAATLAAAIAAGRIGREPDAAEWFAKVDEAAGGRDADEDPRASLVEAVAQASEATAVWLISGGDSPEPVIPARAGPCAGADPVAWLHVVPRVIGAGETIRRPGVGLALPIDLGGERLAMVVEGRAWPQAFSAGAAAAAVAAARRVVELAERRQVGRDLASARAAVETLKATRPSSSDEAPSRASGLRSSTGSHLVELSLGRLELRHPFNEIVGRGSAMRRALRVIDRAVDVDANVLLLGETGTGKEIVARALHDKGARGSGPFIAVNCAAIPRTLAESEFFGHVPGAFTGAGRLRHRGYFEQASGGTLFLDEIVDLEPAVQAKMLRVLEASEVRPVGGEQPAPFDVRIVSAANRDLEQEVAAGRFRADLLYRLAVIEVRLPPLRERAEDIPALVRCLAREVSETPIKVHPDALEALCAYRWPGNVRQLHNEIERAAAFADGATIRAEHLSADVRAARRTSPLRGQATLRQALDELERRLVAEALHAASGNKAAAARTLGVTRMSLHLKLKRLGLLDAALAPRTFGCRPPTRLTRDRRR